jgi:hypothetical protein
VFPVEGSAQAPRERRGWVWRCSIALHEASGEDLLCIPCSDLYAKLLQQTAAEGRNGFKGLSKKEHKAGHIPICFKFADFAGCLLPSFISMRELLNAFSPAQRALTCNETTETNVICLITQTCRTTGQYQN